MPFNARCWTRLPAALVIGTLFLTACAGVGSDGPPGVCPPVVKYIRAEQAQVADEVADEVAALPDDTLIVKWLADYAVLRAQVRACQKFRSTY